MGRVTRKMAAEVAEALHVDEDQVLASGIENLAQNAKDLHLAEQQQRPLDRAPLGEIVPNSADNTSQSDGTTPELKKSTRGGARKPTKKGAKGKNDVLAASTVSPAEELPDADDRTSSPASAQAAEDLMKDTSSSPDIPAEPHSNSTSKRATRAAKATRSRSQDQEVPLEPKSLIDGLGQSPHEKREGMKEEYAGASNGIPQITHGESITSDDALPIDAPASPLPNAVPKLVAHLRADTPAKRSTSNKENVEPLDMESLSPPQQPTHYDALEQAVVAAAMPQAAPAQQQADPITALDNLDEAVENVNKDISVPDVLSSPEKPKDKKEAVEKKTTTRTAKKSPPVVRATKASQARISLSQNADAAGTKAPTLGRPRPSTTLNRSTSVRQAESPGKQQRIASGTNKSPTTEGGEKKEVIIPHSKPRPMSMSFPAPPQPIKSSKAPTQSTFQLPGEAVAAKLKAAREARTQKELEEKKPTFKARPVPSSLTRAPSVRQTTASKARESIMAGRDVKNAGAGSNGGAVGAAPVHKRAQSVATSRPSLSTASKARVTSKGDNKPHLLSTSTFTRPHTATATATARATHQPRPMTALANSSKPRTSLFSSTATMGARSPSTMPTAGSTSKGTLKGKEVFNRPAAAKAAAEKERLEKEAAAKKARAEAAERGRLASREWAEKQKRIAAAKKAAAAEEQVVDEQIGGVSAEALAVEASS